MLNRLGIYLSGNDKRSRNLCFTSCCTDRLFSEKVSLIMTTPDRWICVNVGVDGVDIMAKEMSIVWLVVDFFSNYHRSEVTCCDET